MMCTFGCDDKVLPISVNDLQVFNYFFGVSLVPWFVLVSSIISQNPLRHEARRGMMVKGIQRKMRFLQLSKCRMINRQKICPSSMMPIHMSILWVLAKFHWMWTCMILKIIFYRNIILLGQLGLTWYRLCVIGQLESGLVWFCFLFHYIYQIE